MGMTETATRLIKRFGQTAILRRPGEDSGTPWAPVPGGASDTDVTIAVTQYTTEERGNSLISDSDLRVFMTAGIAPITGDTLVIGGEDFRIHHVGTLGPDGTVICYELRVQK